VQVHGPSETIDRVGAYLNPGSTQPFVVFTVGSVEIYIYTEAEADQLAEAAATAKRLLHDATAAEGDAS